jgi:hypothetical protein
MYSKEVKLKSLNIQQKTVRVYLQYVTRITSYKETEMMVNTFSSRVAHRSVRDLTSDPTESVIMFNETSSLPIDSIRNIRAFGRFFM